MWLVAQRTGGSLRGSSGNWWGTPGASPVPRSQAVFIFRLLSPHKFVHKSSGSAAVRASLAKQAQAGQHGC